MVMCDRKVLLLRRGETAPWMPGYWNLPGGSVDEFQETAESAALRECEEEAGLSIAIIGSILNDMPIFHVETIEEKHEEGLRMSFVYFFGCKLQEMPVVKLNFENDKYEWVDVSAVKEYNCVPGVTLAIKKMAGMLYGA